MRAFWFVAGVVLVLAGVVLGYRLSRTGRPQDAAAPAPALAGRAADAPAGAAPSTAAHPARSDARPETAATPGANGGARGDEPVAESPRSNELTPAERRWYAALDAPSRADEPKDARASGTPSAEGAAGGAEPVNAPRAAGAPHASGGPVPAAAPVVPPAPPTPPAANTAKLDPSKVDPKAAPADDPSSDRRPPVLQGLRFDPPEVQDGGSAILTVAVTDDLSGVKSVFGTIRSPSEAAVIPFVAQDAGGGGNFTATIAIPKKAETGWWFVGTLQILDRANNPLNVAYVKSTVPAGGALQVVSAESDSKAPTVHRVTVEKGAVAGGETNRVIVDVDDDSSGVASVTGSFQSPSKAAQVVFGCAASGDGSWAGTVSLPANADCGEWTIKFLRVTDKANNGAVLTADSPEVGRVGFTVAGSGRCDSEPPVLESVVVAPSVVSNRATSEVVLTLTARDDGSGVGGVSGRVEGPVSTSGQVPRMSFSAKPDPRNPDAPMSTKVIVPELAAKGIWRVTLVEVTDKANNTRTYTAADPVLMNADITVE